LIALGLGERVLYHFSIQPKDFRDAIGKSRAGYYLHCVSATVALGQDHSGG
jgi:hypothetical protein